MGSEIPDFREWHKLEDRSREIFLPSGKSFIRLDYYVKYEPVDKVFNGVNASFYGKEIFKVWTSIDPLKKATQKKIALLLEDGHWQISLPFHETDDDTKFFYVEEDVPNLLIRINILTESGWKNRVIRVE
jgi:hypothetical protein